MPPRTGDTCPVQREQRRPSELTITAILAGLGMLGPFTVDTIFPAFTLMGADLAASPFALQQLISVYLIVYAAFSLFHGPISDALGRRPVIIVGLVLFGAASVGCALAPNLAFLLVMRGVQGVGAGAAQILGRALVRDYFAGEKAQKMMAQVSMIFAVAPALAPIVGAAILGVTSWRGIFWFLAGWSIVMILATLVLPEPISPDLQRRFSPRSVLSGLGRVWANPLGRRLALVGTLHFAATFLYISGAPLVMTLLAGGPGDFWMLFVPVVVGMMLGSWVSGRLAHLPGPRLASIGYVVGTAGWLINLALALIPQTRVLPIALLALPISTFGMSLTFPIINLAMLDLYPHDRGAAASVQGFASLTTNAALAGLIAPLLGFSLPVVATGSLVIFLTAWLMWTRHVRATHLAPTTPDAAAYELTDEL